MRKRLYMIVFMTFTAFFLFTSFLTIKYFKSDPFADTKSMLTFAAIALGASLLFSYFITYILLKYMVTPFNNYTDYLAKRILNRPQNKLDSREREQVNEIMKKYGYNFDEIEEGINTLKDNSKARRDFSANVSHELKSPLTSINGYAEMIASGITKSYETVEFASRIHAEGNRLLKLIDETISLSKLDNHHIRTESLEVFDIGKIIEEALTHLDLLIKEKFMTIHYDYSPINFYGNPRLIYDLVSNLVSNAVKYSSKIEPTLTIKVTDHKDKVVLIFEDNGIGISQDDLPRIFERFYVVDKSRGNRSGTGLGLSLVKNIVGFHKGKIDVNSKLGVGTKFKMVFPKNVLEEN